MNIQDFTQLTYGMFVHYGLFSQMARGEWVMNREGISPKEMEEQAKLFAPKDFDADAICELAVAGGMKYIVFTTMHHDGFRLYNTSLTDYNSYQTCGRDLVEEMVAAARSHGLKIGLYHSLNNWHDTPDAVAALENVKDYDLFIRNTFARLEELVSRYNPIDILWYDGWWPFNKIGWQAEEMNARLRQIQPWLLFNGRNGLPGDFGTPEQHLTAPVPWRPWEACMTLNDHWGFHQADHNWKSPIDVVKMLLTVANGRGNLLLNIGPDGSGRIPQESIDIIRTVGEWLKNGGEAATNNCDHMGFNPMTPEEQDTGDWDTNGVFTASGNHLFLTLLYSPGERYVLNGLRAQVKAVSVQGIGNLHFVQTDEKILIELPESVNQRFAPVLDIECEQPPVIYRTGGLRTPRVKHPRYDPLPPDINY